MPRLWKIVATPNDRQADVPEEHRSVRLQVERGVHQRVGFGVLLARHVREVDLARSSSSSARARACSGLRCGCFTFHRPASCSMTSFESARTCDRAGTEPLRRLEPGDERLVLGDVVGGRRRCAR